MTLNFMLCLFQHVIDLPIAGVQAPLGFWDPAGLSADGDAKEFGGGILPLQTVDIRRVPSTGHKSV